jgi:hypothetical protein
MPSGGALLERVPAHGRTEREAKWTRCRRRATREYREPRENDGAASEENRSERSRRDG